MSFALTWGFDRGIGLTVPLSPYGSGGTGVVGTAPPDGSVLITDVSGNPVATLQEDVDSPTIERGTQATAQHRFTLSYTQALTLINVIGMGLIVQDSGTIGAPTIWRVLTCSIQSKAGGMATLTTVSESVSFDTPPDEFQVNTVDLGIDIIKHPRYFPNLYPTTAEFGTVIGQIKSQIINAILAYRDAPFFPSTTQLTGFLNGFVQNTCIGSLQSQNVQYAVPNPNFNSDLPVVQDTNIQALTATGGGISSPKPPAKATTANPSPNCPVIPVSVSSSVSAQCPSVALALAAAQEIISKLWRQEDSPYLSGIEMKWSQYYFLPPYFNLGSYLEDPTYIVPNYFLQPDRPVTELPPRSGIAYPVAGSNNIFQLNAAVNPQDFSSTGLSTGATQFSWLRKADEIQYERTWFKITYTWVGSAIGYFDPQLYGASARPQYPSDYQTFA